MFAPLAPGDCSDSSEAGATEVSAKLPLPLAMQESH